MNWKRAAPHLEVRKGKRKTSYRVNYRQGGVVLRDVLEATSLPAAKKEAERKIGAARFGPKIEAVAITRCSDLGEKLLAESATQDQATQAIKENIFGKHLIPWLDAHCPLASDLTVETWPQYKLYKRGINPTIALENHSKYFRMLVNRAHELGILKQRIRVRFSVKKEDFRKPGQVITAEHEAKILAECNRVWRNRSIIQRDTGMRPGEVRKLRKDRVRWNSDGSVTVMLLEEDTKTHRYREFIVRSTRAVAAFREQRDFYPDSPFLFAMETDHRRPMDKHTGAWKAALKRAGITQDYTPHDWRHTFATETFKAVGLSGAAIVCYALDMSWEMARTVYFHVSAEDTKELADLAAKRSAAA